MAEEKEVKLLYVFPSPFVLRVVLVLELKGITYEIIPDDLFNKSSLLLQLNPLYKKFPVLIHKGQPICDSRNIIEYLDETFPHTPAVLPRDPLARSRERFLAEFVENKIFATCGNINFGLGATPADLAKSCELFEEELRKHECTPFFAGDKLGLVDIVLLAPAIWARDQMPSADHCPNLHRLLCALRDHPVVKSALPDADTVETLLTQAMPMLEQLYGGKP
ncbi:glutathione S-transferase U7-like [Selaginella moellendorffii]|uniref:glutathione S-transferase U7-like n=1 Tax=Selaginella moellendorffii TaxID=88036 RepID=UPI000D1CEE8B|nr:glutathione S-transferase U7-like [Selaginella moellendorffii]|eukprot:XP_024539281.1 glutathione S-transferase U7-like [Selaginella moellendorffii]